MAKIHSLTGLLTRSQHAIDQKLAQRILVRARPFSSHPVRYQQSAILPEIFHNAADAIQIPISKVPSQKSLRSDSRHSERGMVSWTPDSSAVSINFFGFVHTFPNIWLRDHCLCPECTHPQTKQRLVNTFEIKPKITVTAVRPSTTGLEVEWSDPAHVSIFPWSWLRKHSPFVRKAQPPGDTVFVSPSSAHFPSVEYDSIMKSTMGLNEYLFAVQTYGFCFAPSTPPTTEATKSLVERISFIRPTQYGGFWDFTSISNPTDTAYTSLPLAAHTDTTYFTDPVGLQMFHMLSHTGGSGGESIFIDGFAAARHLHKTDPSAYSVLSNVKIVSHASGDTKAGLIDNTASCRSGFPVFCHHPELRRNSYSYHPSNLAQVRWNNDDRSPATEFPSPEKMESWYAAAKVWSEILRMPEFEITIQLVPGTPVLFDNWRVLHGRKGFTGKRRVCGAYIGMDEFRGRLRGVAREVKAMEERGQVEVEMQ